MIILIVVEYLLYASLLLNIKNVKRYAIDVLIAIAPAVRPISVAMIAEFDPKKWEVLIQ